MTMHSYKTTGTSYATNGSLALQPSYAPAFTVLEGGRGASAAPSKSEHAISNLSHRSVDQGNSVLSLCTYLCVVAVLVFAVFVSDATIVRARSNSFSTVPTSVVTVHEGDSLWALAELHPVEGQSTSDVSSWIRQANGLESSTLYAGQQLVVPAC